MAIIAIVLLIALPVIVVLLYAGYKGEQSPAAPPAEVVRYTQAGNRSSVTGASVKGNKYTRYNGKG